MSTKSTEPNLQIRLHYIEMLHTKHFAERLECIDLEMCFYNLLNIVLRYLMKYHTACFEYMSIRHIKIAVQNQRLLCSNIYHNFMSSLY